MTLGFPLSHPSPLPLHPPCLTIILYPILSSLKLGNGTVPSSIISLTKTQLLSIQKIHIPFSPIEDSIFWAINLSGKFSIKLAYLFDQTSRFSNSGPLAAFEWKKLWSMKFNETQIPSLENCMGCSPH